MLTWPAARSARPTTPGSGATRTTCCQLGGEFGFSRASQHYLAGSTLLEITGAERDAITELERAAELYEAGPEEGEDHSFELRMLAQIELAVARLRMGELDGAGPALGPVLALPPFKRIDPLPQRLETVRAELARSRYHGSARANDLETPWPQTQCESSTHA